MIKFIRLQLEDREGIFASTEEFPDFEAAWEGFVKDRDLIPHYRGEYLISSSDDWVHISSVAEEFFQFLAQKYELYPVEEGMIETKYL